MRIKNRNKLIAFFLVGAFTIFACGLGGDTATEAPPPPPTQVVEAVQPTPVPPTPEPPPTQAPEVPTTAPIEPTAVPDEPTAVPDDPETTDPIITIDQVNGYFDNLDSWRIVGLITNNTDRPVDSIEVEVEIFDAAGASIYDDIIFADLFNLNPGETTPFSTVVFEDLPGADNFVATIVGNSSGTIDRAQLDIRKVSFILDDSGDVHIAGELFNNTDQPIEVNGLAAATFDANGELITADNYDVSIRYLGPGEDGPFRVSTIGPSAGSDIIEDYELYVDAEFADPEEPTGLTVGDAHDYLDYFDNLHLVGQVTNDGTLVLNVRLIAAIYDADGNVLDASTDDLAITALAPGETQPYDFDFWGPLNYTDGLFSDFAATYTVQVDRYWTWENTNEYVDLTTQNDENTFDDFNGEFTGEIVNNTGGPIDSATIVVYLQDLETGEIVGVGYDYVFDEIADGGVAEYQVYVDTPDGFVVSSAEYFIIVKGQLP